MCYFLVGTRLRESIRFVSRTFIFRFRCRFLSLVSFGNLLSLSVLQHFEQVHISRRTHEACWNFTRTVFIHHRRRMRWSGEVAWTCKTLGLFQSKYCHSIDKKTIKCWVRNKSNKNPRQWDRIWTGFNWSGRSCSILDRFFCEKLAEIHWNVWERAWQSPLHTWTE